MTAGDNRDAAYFELCKSFDSVPVVSLKKGGKIQTGWVKIQFWYEEKKAFTMRVVKSTGVGTSDKGVFKS